MSAIYDGTFTSAVQDGGKTVAFPFAPIGDKYCRTTRRTFLQVASSFTPTLADRTTYTNLLTYSEQFDNAAWTKVLATVTANNAANPNDGALTADKIAPSGTDCVVSQSFTPAAGVSYTFSVWLRATSSPFSMDLYFFRVSPFASITSATVSVTTDWQRFSITGTSLDTSSHTVQIGGGVTWGTGEDCWVWGAQVEQSSSRGPYVVTTSASASISSPPTDYTQNKTADSTADDLAYLCDESDMDVSSALMARFERFYCRIPATQTDYTSRSFNRPNLHDVKSGSSYAVSFDDGKTSTVFSSRVSVSTVGAIGTTGALNADTFTVVDSGGASTTQSMNTAASSLQTAIAAALTGLTNITVTQSADVLTITWATGWIKSASTASTNVAMDAGTGYLQFSAAASTNAAPTRLLTTGSAHSFSVGDKVALWNGDRWVGNALVETAPTTTTFTIRADEGSFALGTVAITYAQKASSGTRYANGIVTATCKRVRDFYLPGVTAGISTAADIPLVTVKADPVAWLEAIVAGTAFVPIEVSELQRWAGPIYVREQLQIQMSDALDTATAAA